MDAPPSAAEPEAAPGRLSAATLPSAATSGIVPITRPLEIGIVHFGVGAFHRAHQALYTEDAATATGETGWGILAVTGRSDAVVRQLRPQDCLYSVLEKDATSSSLRVVGAVLESAWPMEDSERVLEVMSKGSTHIATLTVTEKGYLRAADGTVDRSLPEVHRELRLIELELRGDGVPAASSSAIGLLVRGLARRFRRSRAPFTVICCDNVVGNGAMVKGVVTSFASAVDGDRVAEWLVWLESSVAFPSTMVDRIAPAVTEAHRAEAFELLGLHDEALVVAEPFSQWVIEDRFAGPRPAWELAGAILTDDVSSYELTKLRILNATHSLLAYLGSLKGYTTIAEAVGDAALLDFAKQTINDDVLPTLTAPPGLDLGRYRDSVLERFANPSLGDATSRVAMDGSHKLPNRILGTVADRLAQGHVPLGLATVVAAWVMFIAHTVARGEELNDPRAEQLLTAVGEAGEFDTDAAAVVDRVLAIRDIFPASLVTPLRDAVVAQVAEVRRLTRGGRS